MKTLQRTFSIIKPDAMKKPGATGDIISMLEKNGFSVIKIKHFSLEYGPFGWWQTMLNLLGCETNFAYKFLKRGEVRKADSLAARTYTIFCSALLGAPLLLPAFLLSFAESALSRGGVVTIIARIRPEEN